MNLNYLGVIPIFLVIIGALIASILILKDSRKIKLSLSEQDYNKFIANSYKLRDGIIFKETSTHQVLRNGTNLIIKDNFDLLQDITFI